MVVDLSPAQSGDQENVNINPNAIVPQGQITIIKDAAPNSPQDFGFTITGPSGAPIPANFILDDDGDPTTPSQITFVGLPEGTYIITEQVTSGWNLTSLTTVENGAEDTTAGDISSSNIAGRSISITVANGEVWTATFTNTVVPAPLFEIDVNKVTYSNGDVADAGDGVLILASSPSDPAFAGSDVVWRYGVSLTGASVARADIDLTDDQGVTPEWLTSGLYVVGDTDTDNALDQGETWIAEATGTATVGPYTNTGTVEASATNAGGTTERDDTDTSSYTGVVAAIDIEKTGTLDLGADNEASVGDTITYTLTVRNTGGIALTDVTLSDLLPNIGIGALTDTGGDGATTLAAGATETATATYVLTQADIDAGIVENTAEATGTATDTFGNTADPVDSAEFSVDVPQNAAIQIVKTGAFDAGADGYADPGELITYSFSVTNEGNISLTNVTATDPLVGPLTFTGGDTDADGELDVTETWTYSATYAVIQDDIDAGSVYNTATADSAESDEDTDDHTETLPQNAAITISKTTVVWTDDGQIDQQGDGLSGVQWGDEVSWRYAVTNTGNVTFTDVHIVDDNGTPGDASDDFDTDGTNAPPQPTIALYAVDQDGNGIIDGDDGNGILDAGEDWASYVSQAEIDGLAVGGTWYYSSAPRSVVENGTVTYSNIATVTGTTELDLTATDDDSSGYVSLNAGYVTDSNFCDFGDTFNVIWSPDINGTYRETATQPGQFFYNVFGDFQQLFDDGDDSNNVLTLHIPDGFALQSPDAFFEQAIHVYDEYFVDPHSGELCFVWGEEVSRDEYSVDYIYNANGTFDVRITFDDDASATGNFAVNIHLDHETEGVGGYTYANNGTGHQDMVNGPTGTLANGTDIYNSTSVLDGTDYYFYATTGTGADEEMIATSGDTVSNVNDVKKFNYKGFAGFVWNDDGDGQYESGEGLAGRRVELWRGNNRIETMTTDDDGWYLSNFMHKGKLATYEIRIYDDEGNLGSGTNTYFSSGTLSLGKGNHFEMVSFDDSDNQIIHA